MPVLLKGVVRFPQNYSPWYVYTATLVASPASFTYMDILFPDASGNWDRLVTTDAVLTAGYAFALEAFADLSDTTRVQVAIPGSAVPFIADNTVRPTGLVKFVFGSTVQNVTVAAAADLAAGKVIGRMRCHHKDHSNLRITATNDVIIINTGLC